MDDAVNLSGKPRKPREDTLSYLREYLNSDDISISELARSEASANVSEEIRDEVASIASHKEGSDLLERLARQCPKKNVEMLLRRCEGYASFLARHRHSSHVLQSLLALAGDEIGDGEDEISLHRGCRCGIRLWRALLVAESDDVLGIISDWNSTHVARAIFWTMAGLPVAPESRGRRNERHAHSIDDARALTESQLKEKATSFAKYTQQGCQLLNSLTIQLSHTPIAQLQRSCLDPSAGPALAVLLRVLALLPDAHDATRLVETVLELDNTDTDRAADIVYGLAHDERGSIVLEAVVKVSEDIRFAIVQKMKTQNRISAYVAGNVSNYVLQTLLRATESLHTLDELGLAILNDQTAQTRLLTSDRSGLVCALAETALHLNSSNCGPRIASLYLACPNLETIVLRQAKPKVHEYGARALSACLCFDGLNITGCEEVLQRIFLQALTDAAPWSRKLVDVLLEHAPTPTTSALKNLESETLIDLIISAETKHRAAPNPVARIFLPESRLNPKVQRNLLKTLRSHTEVLKARASAFFRMTRMSLKSSSKTDKLISKVATANSAAALLPDILKSGDDNKKKRMEIPAEDEKKRKKKIKQIK
mmetsp:Transcript_13588/g.20274  ORF Transcript_13588/g.20274 Transcript_13588/m.20274 type:complete len:597 (+) Transcript_13588:42-1832(+)